MISLAHKIKKISKQLKFHSFSLFQFLLVLMLMHMYKLNIILCKIINKGKKHNLKTLSLGSLSYMFNLSNAYQLFLKSFHKGGGGGERHCTDIPFALFFPTWILIFCLFCLSSQSQTLNLRKGWQTMSKNIAKNTLYYSPTYTLIFTAELALHTYPETSLQ